MQEIRIEEKNSGQRMDKYLLRYFPQMSKGFLYKMLRKKNICLNQKKAEGNELLAPEDRIQIYFSEETFAEFRRSNRKKAEKSFDILYEDEDVLVLNKPAGLLSQPNGKDANLIDELAGYLAEERFGVISRLDRNTTGALLVGKNVRSLQHLSGIRIQKVYHAILCGKLQKELFLKDFLQKDEQRNQVLIYRQNAKEEIDPAGKHGAVRSSADFGLEYEKRSTGLSRSGRAMLQGLKKEGQGREIITKAVPLAQEGDFTLVRVELEQGKPHQIRAHLANEGMPILGDFKYGDRQENESFRRKYGLTWQLLHSYEVIWEERRVVAPYPKLFDRIRKDIFGF